MKRSLFIISCLVIIISSVVAAEKEDAGLLFVKTLIEKSRSENGYVNALRYFQYTATTAKNNPSSYVLSKWGKEAMDESGLKPADKGKYLSILSNRKGARIEKLWKENKDELLNLFSAALYNEILKYEVDSLIEFRTSPEFAGMMKKMKAKSKRPGVKTVDHAGAVTGWSGYKQLSFWYRRDFEKNDKVVFEILKELKAHYTQQ
jgi:hypothetical protein